jgi:predicted nucleic-acid-binding Zn-ribbon protein
MKSPACRQTKECPKCHDTAVFRDRVVRPGAGATQYHHAQCEFVAAWKCENPECDYFEELLKTSS